VAEQSTEARWYVVHTQAGHENRVRHNLEHRIDSLGMKDAIPEVLVPTEEVAEIRGGQKRVSTRRFFPGYVLVKMVMNEETWYLVKNTPGVAKFVGAGNAPVPLTEKEIDTIMQQTEERQEKPQPKVVFETGERVKVIEGPFVNFTGVIDDVQPEKGKLRVMVSIFGRPTPVELEYWQVERV